MKQGWGNKTKNKTIERKHKKDLQKKIKLLLRFVLFPLLFCCHQSGGTSEKQKIKFNIKLQDRFIYALLPLSLSLSFSLSLFLFREKKIKKIKKEKERKNKERKKKKEKKKNWKERNKTKMKAAA